MSHRVWEASVWIARDVCVGDAREFLDVGAHLRGTKGTIEADGKWTGVDEGDVEGLKGLTREGAAGIVGDGTGDHER